MGARFPKAAINPGTWRYGGLRCNDMATKAPPKLLVKYVSLVAFPGDSYGWSYIA